MTHRASTCSLGSVFERMTQYRQSHGTEREKAAIGALISMEEPTKPMQKEAAATMASPLRLSVQLGRVWVPRFV